MYFSHRQRLDIAKDTNDDSFLFFYTCLRCCLQIKVRKYDLVNSNSQFELPTYLKPFVLFYNQTKN